MTILVLLQTFNDVVRMSRVDNKKVTSVVDYEPAATIAADVEYYRVNDVDDPYYILEKYLSGKHREHFIVVEKGKDWENTLYQTKSDIIKFKNKIYEVCFKRFHHNPIVEDPQIYEVVEQKSEKIEYIRA